MAAVIYEKKKLAGKKLLFGGCGRFLNKVNDEEVTTNDSKIWKKWNNFKIKNSKILNINLSK